jgi:hypothetical protein
VSIQVVILKVLASHGNGRATLASLKTDIAILTASGPDWDARIKRLAARVGSIDIFGNGYVVCDGDGWEITGKGRDFLHTLEALTQDNRQDNRQDEHEPDGALKAENGIRPPGDLIVVGHRFKSRRRAPMPSRVAFAREESALKLK